MDNLPNNPMTKTAPSLDFHLPADLEAGEPPEARGLKRDQVRLMVSFIRENRIEHTQFRQLPRYLQAGDVLVVNTSGTRNAALLGYRAGGAQVELRLSTCLPADLWVVELRRPLSYGSQPIFEARPGELIALPGKATARLLTPYRSDQRNLAEEAGASNIRLWIASLKTPFPVDPYLARYGFPIRYKYVREEWPLSYYQNVYADEMGSAEMPSAGRAFTRRLLGRLKKQGVKISPLVLHTGVASPEIDEPPYEEYYRVPAETARVVNAAHGAGKRVIAVGTTVVRALETVSEPHGIAQPGEGWTKEIITPQRGLYVIDGLLTGLHEPRSSHLSILEALAGLDHLQRAYQEAIRGRYLWHEFGDLHLILP